MKNPNNSGSLAEYWENVADYKGERMLIPGEIGRIFDQFIVIKDPRAPTMVVGGSDGSYTLQIGYVQPGNNDDRNNSAWANTSGNTNYVFDLAAIMGANAIGKFTYDEMVSNLSEDTEYGQIQGRAAYKGEGIQLPTFDKDTPTASTQIQRGSCIVPVSRRAIGTIN
jgi:hypothetical protein